MGIRRLAPEFGGLPAIGHGGRWLPAAALTAALLGLLAACGGGSSGSRPTGPTAVATPTPAPTPIPLVVVSGETGAPVAGASVTVGSFEQTTDAAGAFTAPAGTRDDALVDVVAPGFLDRQTTVGRAAGAGRFALWPVTSPTGLDEHFTRDIVYTSGDESGAAPLLRWRPSLGEIRVLLGTGFDPSLGRTVDNQVDAAREMNELLGGSPLYLEPEFSDEEPDSGAVIVKIDADDPICENNVLALARRFIFGNGELARSELIYCAIGETQRINIVRHEFGHTIGLNHSGDDYDLMYPFDTSARFTDRERLVVRLMYQRPAGNRFPDDDRSAGGTLGRALVETIVCPR